MFAEIKMFSSPGRPDRGKLKHTFYGTESTFRSLPSVRGRLSFSVCIQEMRCRSQPMHESGSFMQILVDCYTMRLLVSFGSIGGLLDTK